MVAQAHSRQQCLSVVDQLPHKAPALMVDQLLAYHPAGAITSFLPKPENIYRDGDKLGLEGLIEHIAQSVALKKTMDALVEKRPPSKGYLASITELQISAAIPIGQTITTEIQILKDLGTAVKAQSVTYNLVGEVIGTSEMVFALAKA